ncbi:hypothetical protein [Streptomyces sp. NPDC060075]
MGTVRRAEDELLERQVALKVLHEPPHMPDDTIRTLHERTRREARSAARIAHPHVIVVYDVAEYEGLPCIVMECPTPQDPLHLPSARPGESPVGSASSGGARWATPQAWPAGAFGLIRRRHAPGSTRHAHRRAPIRHATR